MLLGPFSRSLVLPLDVYPERTEATILNGILTIRIPIRAEQHRLRVRALDIPLKPLKLNILSMPTPVHARIERIQDGSVFLITGDGNLSSS